MKKIVFLLCLVHSLSARTQTFTPKQYQGSLQEAEKAIRELEKDNPAMAKKLRQMMKQKGPTVKAQMAVSPRKFISPITAINLQKTPIPPTSIQATGRLLWYKGKKLNDSLLVMTNGTIVLYRPKKNELVVQPSVRTDIFKPLVKELANNGRQKDALISYFAVRKNGFFYYPALQNILKEYDRINETYFHLLKNTIALPGKEEHLQAFYYKSAGLGSVALLSTIIAADIPKNIKILHDQTMNAMKDYPSLDFPPPPARDYSVCFDCDSSVSKKYDQECSQWDSSFNAYETAVIRMALRVQRALALPIYDNDTEAQQMKANMDMAIEFGLNRLKNKVGILIKQYGHDFPRLPVVIRIALSVERQRQLMGLGNDNETGMLNTLASLLKGFDRFFEQQMKERNYNLVFNMAFVLGLERQKQLLGVDEDNSMACLDKIMAFNRFKLHIDVDASIASENLVANAGAITTQDAQVSLGFYNCRFQLFQASTDYQNDEENNYRIPMAAKGGEKKIKDQDDRWITYNYSGPKELLGLFPPASISFCNEGKDSIFLQPPIVKPGDMTSSAAASVKNAYTLDYMAYLAAPFFKQTEAAAMQGEEIGLEMVEAFTTEHNSQSTGDARLDRLQSDYNLSVKTRDLQNRMAGAINQNALLVLFNAHNQDAVLIDAEAKSSRPQDGMDIQGRVKIKLVHDPLPDSDAKTGK